MWRGILQASDSLYGCFDHINTLMSSHARTQDDHQHSAGHEAQTQFDSPDSQNQNTTAENPENGRRAAERHRSVEVPHLPVPGHRSMP